MAIKEIKREWSPEQLDHVKHFLLHYERDVKDLPKCCVGSRATVSETDNEYVCAECGWVRAEYVELLSICPDLLTDPDVKIYYDPDKTEIGEKEFYQNADIQVAYFPNVTVIRKNAFFKSKIKAAIFPNVTTAYNAAFQECVDLKTVYFPRLTENYFGVFYKCTALTEVSFPAWEVLARGSEFGSCTSLVSVNLPKLKDMSNYSFNGCSALKKVDFPCLEKMVGRSFDDSGVETLILRGDKVCNLTAAFRFCSIASGTGYIYVPKALIEDYKVATNWSTYAAQFRAIEDYPEICDPDWEGHSGDVVIPSGSTLTIKEGATVNDEAGALGGGATSWNDLTDRPFYTEVKEVALATDASVTISNSWSSNPAFALADEAKNIFDGAAATVTINGTEYKCNWVDCSAYSGWENWFCLGNLSFANSYNWGDKDTGEPFVFEYYPSIGEFWLYHTTDATYKVSLTSQHIHPLDSAYLSDDVVTDDRVYGLCRKVLTLTEGTTTLTDIKDALNKYVYVQVGNGYVYNGTIGKQSSTVYVLNVLTTTGEIGTYTLTFTTDGVLSAVTKEYRSGFYMKGKDGNNYYIYVNADGELTAQQQNIAMS